MPTLRALRDSGAAALASAIMRHGGPGAVAAALSLRHQRGNFDTWDALWADLQRFMAAKGTPAGIMPSRRAFLAAGRGDLYRRARHAHVVTCLHGRLSPDTLVLHCSALLKCGGIAAVARRAGLVYRKARVLSLCRAVCGML